ncbi:MAG: BrnA antitoxin family protein [Chloroflexota bacterium]|nr:BrnA antitoxin family protein [Chloroflexota bacterium]
MSKIPQFNSVMEESDFWDTHEVTDFLDELTEVDVIFVDARRKKIPVSMRLEQAMVTQLKTIARRQGIGYQTLIRMWLLERLAAQPLPAAVQETTGTYHAPKP